MNSTEKLKKELERLRKKREDDEEVKNLKKQIKAERFSQTKTGKVFNFVGKKGGKALDSVGRVGKKLLTAPTNANKPISKKKSKPQKNMSIEEVMRRLPQ